jgi:hypothetical protein
MGFSTHPDRLYEFFDHQELQFLYDDNDNYYDGMARRADRRKEALRSIMLEKEGVQPDTAIEDTSPGNLSPDAKIDINSLYNASSDMQTFF